MNSRLMLEKTIDLLVNVAVVSVGVSIYEKKLYGFVVAVFAYLLALGLCTRIRGKQ